MVILAYTNGKDTFEWDQFCIASSFHMNTEGVELEEFNLGGRSYLYYSNLGVQSLLWKSSGYAFICEGTVSKDMLIDIAESIKIK